MTEPSELAKLLRPGLLAGVSVVLAGTEGGGTAAAIGPALRGLGAEVHECELRCSGEPEADDARVQEALAGALSAAGGVQALVVDGAGPFPAPPTGAGARPGAEGGALIDSLEAAWRVTRAVANAAFIAGDAGGRIVYLAPPTGPGAATHAEAARAGLENLARTLSIEWARYGITPVSLAPGAHTAAAELAGVVAYLLSPAGAYFSGAQLDLRGAPARAGAGA